MRSLIDFFVDQLMLIFDSEKQLLEILPKLISNVSSLKLKAALAELYEETRGQVKRLEQIFHDLGKIPNRHTSRVMESLLRDALNLIHSDYEMIVKEFALIDAIQRIKHFEIASYGVLKALAKHFKHKHIHELLQMNSKEEGKVDKKFTTIAKVIVNPSKKVRKSSRRAA